MDEREQLADGSNRPQPGQPQTSGKAIASLLLGILSFCVPFLPAIASIILAILGMRDVSASKGRLRGQGLAITGIVLSVIACLAMLVAIPVAAILFPAVVKVREAADRAKTTNNLKQIALAVHNYASTYQDRLPPAAIYSQDGKPLLSWRVTLLPYVEHDVLYKRFKLDEPWDSPNNRALLAQMPKVYERFGVVTAEPNTTFFRTFVGEGTLFSGPRGTSPYSIATIPDGTSNTVFAVEAADAVPWTKPDELTMSQPFKLGQPNSPVFLAVMMDGSVRMVNKNVSQTTLRNAINPKDGQLLGPDW